MMDGAAARCVAVGVVDVGFAEAEGGGDEGGAILKRDEDEAE